uniref:Uncharacterized protein n=1 Tax=Branchiostoma floridae TaxID=7739 RepID=C3ZMF2_BRAFL|eukprot:XP_002590397.1 hypothetical protein BRAFLDRAFT_76671 [Branchiostoma floridae]
MGRGVNVAGFIRQTKGFSSENKRSADIIAEVLEKVSADRTKISEFERQNKNSTEWAGLSTLKGVNQSLRDECQSCAEKIRRNAEKQKEEYRYIWETIIATKRGVSDFLDKHGLGQYTSSLTEFGYEEVEDLLDAEIKTDGDLADDRCWVVLDGQRLQMPCQHLRTLRQEINNLRKRIVNIPHRMKNIISNANEAASISNRFLEACRDSVNRTRRLENETRAAHDRTRYHKALTTAATGLQFALAGTLVAVTGGVVFLTGSILATTVGAGAAGVFGAVGAAVGAGGVGVGGAAAAAGTGAVGVGILQLAGLLIAEIFSVAFKEKMIDNLKDHQRKMGEKAQELKRQWLNDIHACVKEMESNSSVVKHKLVILPSSANSIRSEFETIFENIDTLQSNAKKYESGYFQSGHGSSTYCLACGTSPCRLKTLLKNM